MRHKWRNYCVSFGIFISNEDLAPALRAHKAAVDETKSPRIDEADGRSYCRIELSAVAANFYSMMDAEF